VRLVAGASLAASAKRPDLDYVGNARIGQHGGVSDKPSPVDQALNLFFFAPLGLLLNADEIIPQLVEKGRQQVQMARTIGPFVVQQGQVEAGKAVAKLQKQAADLAGVRTPKAPREDAPAPAPAPVANGPVVRPAPNNAPAVGTLAIPDYESLSASQVVPRLEGLSHGELDAVRGYEAAHRGRKTILNKIAQLQG